MAVRVGEEGEGGFRRFTMPISYLYHPQFERLLQAAKELYGYPSSGPLILPCSVDEFLHLRWLIEKEESHSHHHHHSPRSSSSSSLHSC
ncbi:unnamed protein product [Spirodela intermedia]|nr:unnamed protein product [Spirodela intermedia]CAA6664320.1 unnamed protein product [Spirodela intermedia]